MKILTRLFLFLAEERKMLFWTVRFSSFSNKHWLQINMLSKFSWTGGRKKERWGNLNCQDNMKLRFYSSLKIIWAVWFLILLFLFHIFLRLLKYRSRKSIGKTTGKFSKVEKTRNHHVKMLLFHALRVSYHSSLYFLKYLCKYELLQLLDLIVFSAIYHN